MRTCRTCKASKPLNMYERNGMWNGKPMYRTSCKACRYAEQLPLARERRRRRRVKLKPHNAVYSRTGDDPLVPNLLYDYRFARDIMRRSHEDTLLWLSKGYGIRWESITSWPIESDARTVTTPYHGEEASSGE